MFGFNDREFHIRCHIYFRYSSYREYPNPRCRYHLLSASVVSLAFISTEITETSAGEVCVAENYFCHIREAIFRCHKCGLVRPRLQIAVAIVISLHFLTLRDAATIEVALQL